VTEATEKGIVAKGAEFSEDEYAGIQNFNDAMKLLSDAGITVANAADEIGDGFVLIKGDDEKARLIGVPFILISWNFNAGDFGKPFVSARGITQDGLKFVLNDGGSGIRDQLDKYKGDMGGLFVPHGLRRSDYGLDADDKPVKLGSPESVGKATTFYLDTSK
jgi:hypothetical protein